MKANAKEKAELESLANLIIEQLETTSSTKPKLTSEIRLACNSEYEPTMEILSKLKADGIITCATVMKAGKDPEGAWWKTGVVRKMTKDVYARALCLEIGENERRDIHERILRKSRAQTFTTSRNNR